MWAESPWTQPKCLGSIHSRGKREGGQHAASSLFLRVFLLPLHSLPPELASDPAQTGEAALTFQGVFPGVLLSLLARVLHSPTFPAGTFYPLKHKSSPPPKFKRLSQTNNSSTTGKRKEAASWTLHRDQQQRQALTADIL